MNDGGFVVPSGVAKAIAARTISEVSSYSVFVPLAGEKGHLISLDYGDILSTEEYNQKVRECLAYYAKSELLHQRVRELETTWGLGEYALRLLYAADEWLIKARDLRRELEERVLNG